MIKLISFTADMARFAEHCVLCRDLPDPQSYSCKTAHLFCIAGGAILVGHDISTSAQHNCGKQAGTACIWAVRISYSRYVPF